MSLKQMNPLLSISVMQGMMYYLTLSLNSVINHFVSMITVANE